MPEDMIIRAYDPAEAASVRTLLTAAFETSAEADLVEALRGGGDTALELVAENKKNVVGYVALSRMASPTGWLALAPVATDPKMQKKGIGSALCHMALQYANAPVVVLGDPAYYARFGFDYDRAKRLNSPFPVEYTGLFAPDLEEKQPKEELIYATPFMGAGV